MNEVQPKKLKPIEAVELDLKKMENQFKETLPPHIPAERFVRFLITYIKMNPRLLEADRLSLYKASIQCAQHGLMPDGREAALVPFRLKQGGLVVSYQPMVFGIIKAAYNTGWPSTISVENIYEGDEFQFWIDEDGKHILHRPMFANRSDDKITHAYTIVKNKLGHVDIEVMSRSEIEAIRERSKAKDSGPWRTDYAEMCKKTVLKRASKKWPSSPELQRTIDADNEFYDVEEPRKEIEGPKRKRTRLQKLIEAKPVEAEFEAPPASEPETLADVSDFTGG